MTRLFDKRIAVLIIVGEHSMPSEHCYWNVNMWIL